MSDISFNIGWPELFLYFGWPGLILGAAAGAYLWRKRRIAGGAIGAAIGILVWGGIGIAIKLF